ncbi:MAG: hypothetical protein MI919_39725 [Holophagales bacterium]|nr:hypothetical protein [Holophagales bacterium]
METSSPIPPTPPTAQHHPGRNHHGRTRGRARRSRLGRFLAFALLLLFMPIFVFGATVAATGTVTVQVAEHGPGGVNLWIPVPALLVDVAVMAVPMVIPDDALADARREIAPYRHQIRALAEALEQVPAGSVLVDVRDGSEHVRIAKDWRNFEITVESPDTDVKVSVPTRLLSRALDIFG